MKLYIPLIMVGLTLSSCAELQQVYEQQQQQQLAADQNLCAQFGFMYGTSEFADCMMQRYDLRDQQQQAEYNRYDDSYYTYPPYPTRYGYGSHHVHERHVVVKQPPRHSSHRKNTYVKPYTHVKPRDDHRHDKKHEAPKNKRPLKKKPTPDNLKKKQVSDNLKKQPTYDNEITYFSSIRDATSAVAQKAKKEKEKEKKKRKDK